MKRFTFPRRGANYWLYWNWKGEEHALFASWKDWAWEFPRRHLKESFWCFGPLRVRVRHGAA